MGKETQEFGDNILDLRMARWRKDPVTRALLAAIDRMTDDERLHLLRDGVGFIFWSRENNKPKASKDKSARP